MASGGTLNPNLRSMLSAEELRQRPSRPADYAAENQALVALAQELASSPQGILQKLADTALDLCRAHSAGLSLLEEEDGKSNFHWRAIAGQWSTYLNGGTPRDFGPCGTVLDHRAAMICSHPEVDFPYRDSVRPVLEDALLIPFFIKDEAVGTIWVIAHDTSRRFDAEDLRAMTSLGVFAATAYQTWLNWNAMQRAASIVESSHDAIFGEDLNGMITSWNRGAERIFGYMAAEVIGKPVTILIPPDRHYEDTAILEQLRSGEHIGSYETVRRRKDGSPVDISLTVSPLKGTEGKVIGASKIARTITERLRSERALRESEARMKAAVDLLRLGRYAWNPQTNEFQWDDTLRAMWGLSAGAPIDYEVWRAGVHPDDLARVEAAIERSVDPRGDGVCETEYRVIGKMDGVERWIATRGHADFENNVPVSFFGIAMEVTDHKRVEGRLERRVDERTRELEEANRQLRSQIEKREVAEAEVQQLQRLDAIGQITSGVAHDFNNLLSVVLTNADLLSRSVQMPDDREGIELIRNAVERGAKLIAQLLAFSRQQKLEPQKVDLNGKLVGMGNLLRVTLGGTLQLKMTFAPDLWPALVDPNQIEMIVLNLAINARDAMRPGGTLSLETFNTIVESASSRPEEPLPGDYVAIAVKDTGIGIPDEVLPHVFEPFFTTKEPGKGSGLGLAQVFGFAKQSGGGLRLETGLGQGTAVTIFLPRAAVRNSDDQARVAYVSNRPQTFARLRVLVVDDDVAVLKSTVRMLNFLGHATASAESAAEALRLLARSQAIDLVLADFAMPEMSGRELVNAIRVTRPTLPVVLMTGYRNLDLSEEMRDLRFILKPFIEGDLVNAIGAALR